MGHVTIFTLTKCPHCQASKALLAELGVTPDTGLVNVDVQKTAWRKRQLPALLGERASGAVTFPQIFLGAELVGGNSELQALHQAGELKPRLEALRSGPAIEFPPPFPEPSKEQLLSEVPSALKEKWTAGLGMLDRALGGGMSSLLIMVEGPKDMIVLCTAGEPSATELYAAGNSAPKGATEGENTDEQLYCQMALENNETMFVDDPSKVPGLEKNEDYLKFGYGYYIGAPWRQKGGTSLTGTIAVMEKVPNKIKPEHVKIVELFRDLFQQDISLL
eukprot:TRINITY_DN274_c0_g1_i1.p1 TRINITY_DN274_c0_g1~~TRINITY_DN274_c0_g1_i1.p1  ORF type:complete len:276 (-),score=63.34 TRINITY_DN274_c0_g1_i1:81-908(-)